MRSVFALCTTASGSDILRAISDRISLAGIIGLRPDYPADGVAGFVDMKKFSQELGVRFIPVETYELSGPLDVTRLGEEQIDVLLVVGWQRLIPSWLINHCSEGALGLHGTPGGISAGRGRSPQNWSLILGASEFTLSLFLIDEGVDSGKIISSTTVQYEPEDDINSSHIKVAMIASDLIVRAMQSGRSLIASARPQTGPVFYFPQRLREDGAIDWSRSTEEVSRFVRALAHPYPGAFTWLGEQKIMIWNVTAVSGLKNLARERKNIETPGKVVFESTAGLIVIRTGDGYVLARCWSLESRKKLSGVLGEVFSSVCWQEQLGQIASRHKSKYPNFMVSPLLLEQFTVAEVPAQERL